MVALTTDPTLEAQIQQQVRDIVFLLMQRPITEEIAMQVETYAGFEHLEIDNGEWVGFDEAETMRGEEHGRIEFILLLLIGNFIMQHKLGMLYPGDTTFVLDGKPGAVKVKRRPDLGYVRDERIKKTAGYIYAAPDIAIEIITPAESIHVLRQKMKQYLQYQVQQVWHVYPTQQQIEIHLPDGTSRTYNVGDTIQGGELLPNFTLAVAQVFAS
jgi:Uma2 family endonuclease